MNERNKEEGEGERKREKDRKNETDDPMFAKIFSFRLGLWRL